MKSAIAVVLASTLCAAGKAAIVRESVEYSSGDATLEGVFVYDDTWDDARPAVLVVHEWWGLNDYAKMRARQLAELGYVAFAVDMYGKGVLAKDRNEAAELAGQFRVRWDEGGRALMRARAQAGLEVLAGHRLVDPTRLAAIGYCFGGTTVLELAYSGADLAGVVSFHGGLTVPDEADLPNIGASLLILHGAADSSVQPETIASLHEALEEGGADWQMTYYAGALHGFTNPDNERAYHATADRRSWDAMQRFFDEVFGQEHR